MIWPILTLLWFGSWTTAFVGGTVVLVVRLTPEGKRARSVRWLVDWGVKGLAIPVLIWALMNVGLAWYLQPFMPAIQAAQNRRAGWAPEFVDVLAHGLFVLSSYWSAVTLGWLLVSALQVADAEARKDFRSLSYTCLLVLSIPAGILFLVGGPPAFGIAATLMLAPMAGYGASILQPKKLPPMYARAVARMKFGKYSEAEWEIIRELEKSEDDYDGWMMLAELYANQFKNLAEAERTVLEICEQPATTPSQLSVALHRLADWHLKLAQDPRAARRALQLICDRLKGTHLAHMAQLRINQLPISREELRRQQTARSIPLPALGDHLEESPPPLQSEAERRKAAEEANACVERLKEDPNNISARERLARLLAEQLGHFVQGLEQLSLLLDMPEQPESKRAEWLSLSAAWNLKYLRNYPQARKCLERLSQEFPHTPQALSARRRLELMERETKRVAVKPHAPGED